VEWLKNLIQQSKSGDKQARRRLLFTAGLAFIALALVISGQIQSVPTSLPKARKSLDISVGVGVQYVHITGEVIKPGVYSISPGTRLFEVIAMAGGFSKKANRDSINLARLVTDGEQIEVSSGSSSVQQNALLNLNRAVVSDLDRLPGIGPTLAGRIVDWRKANGGFSKKEDLQKVSGIGPKLYKSISNLVTT